MHKLLYILIITLFFSACQQKENIDHPQENGQHIHLAGARHHAATEKEVDQLFVQLKVARHDYIIRSTQEQIRQLWLQSEDDAIDTLMESGKEHMYRRQYPDAIRIFTRVIEQAPAYAEGWNKRATIHYLMGNFGAALQDIQATLRLEDRHFGALSGKASILQMQGKNEKALATYERLLEIVPRQREVQQHVQNLRAELGYRNI